MCDYPIGEVIKLKKNTVTSPALCLPVLNGGIELRVLFTGVARPLYGMHMASYFRHWDPDPW